MKIATDDLTQLVSFIVLVVIHVELKVGVFSNQPS